MESSGPPPPFRQEDIAQNCSGRIGIEDILDLLSTVIGSSSTSCFPRLDNWWDGQFQHQFGGFGANLKVHSHKLLQLGAAVGSWSAPVLVTSLCLRDSS